MNLFEEVKNLSRRSVLEEMLKVRSMVVPAPDVSKFSAFDEKMIYSESLFWVVTEMAGGRLFVGPPLICWKLYAWVSLVWPIRRRCMMTSSFRVSPERWCGAMIG